jgi:prepilin-type N-terminal cleavage/methylation domain-containing protein
MVAQKSPCRCEESSSLVIARLAKTAEATSAGTRGLPRTLRVLAMTGRRNAGKMKKVTLSSQIRKAFQGHSRGFTLVEVLITIALIGAISVAFFSFMSAATSALIHADERTIAESLARRQLEFVKDQGYNSTLVNGQVNYLKIPNIPVGYTIWSVSRNGTVVNGGANDRVIGIPWVSGNNTPAPSDTGLQMIALVIEHQGKVISTFVNNNPNWANGVKITMEGYKRES